MKTFVSKVKNLSQKAAEIRAAMQQLPPKVAEVREALAATTGQLQQLKSEIQYSVADLKADDEDRLTAALQEIHAGEDVFEKAGFRLSGVDLEISPVQRMLVHLARVDDVHSSVLRTLLSANQPRRTIHAILSSLLQAKQMAETVELGALSYAEVAVGVGPIPSVRLCWRLEEAGPDSAALAPTVVPVSAPYPPPPASPATVFAQSTFFEKPATRPQAASVATQAEQTPVHNVPDQPTPPVESAAVAKVSSAGLGTAQDPLARFKKMPDLHTIRR